MRQLILLTMLALFSTIGVKAQITADPDTTFHYCIDAGTYDLHSTITNSSSSSQSVTWEVIDYKMPPGWSVTQICDNISCLTNINTGTKNTTSILAQEDMDLKVTYNLLSTADEGEGITIIEVRSSAGATNAIFIGRTCWPVAVETIDAEDFTVRYSAGKVTIVKGSQNNAQNYTVFNAYGQKVASGSLPQGIQEIDFDNQAAGMYIIELSDDQGRTIGAQKFSNL